MRTADICPTCSTYSNALCTLYNGATLPNTGILQLDSLETALIKIDSWASTVMPQAIGNLTDVNVTGLINGQVLSYNSTSGDFEPYTIPSGVDKTGYLVGTLPAGTVGDRTHVTDSSVVASGNFGATVVGGGANTVPVFFDGTNWIIA